MCVVDSHSVSLHLLGTQGIGGKSWIMYVWFVLCQGHTWLTAAARFLGISNLQHPPLLRRWVFVLPLKVPLSAPNSAERKWVKGPHYFKWGLTEPNKEHKTEQFSQAIAPRQLKQDWELNYSPLRPELSLALLLFPCPLVSARWTRYWQRSFSSAVALWLVVPIRHRSVRTTVFSQIQGKKQFKKNVFSSSLILQHSKIQSTPR